MNHTPETVARLLDPGTDGARRGFITPAIVAEVLAAKPGRFGYLVCGWPSTEQQRAIHRLAGAHQRMRTADGFPCPAPAVARQDDYRLGMAHGYRTGLDWDGMTPEGIAYAGGAAMGRFWRFAKNWRSLRDDPR